MRNVPRMMKQSGDVHPPELDDVIDQSDLEPQQQITASSARPAQGAPRRSLMPLVAMLLGGLFLVRLLR